MHRITTSTHRRGQKKSTQKGSTIFTVASGVYDSSSWKPESTPGSCQISSAGQSLWSSTQVRKVFHCEVSKQDLELQLPYPVIIIGTNHLFLTAKIHNFWVQCNLQRIVSVPLQRSSSDVTWTYDTSLPCPPTACCTFWKSSFVCLKPSSTVVLFFLGLALRGNSCFPPCGSCTVKHGGGGATAWSYSVCF